MRTGLISSTSYFALRTPDGVGGGASTAPDNAGGAPAGDGALASEAAPAPAAGTAPVVAEAAPVAAAPAAPVAEAPPAAEPAAKPEPHTPSLIEAAKGKDAAADGAAKPDAAAAATETPARAGDQTVAAEPAKEPAKDPSAETGAEKAKAGDAAPEVKPPEPVKYDAFKVPDAVKLDDDRLKAFTDIVSPNGVKQEVAQQLVDLHIAEMQRVQDYAAKAQRDFWTKQIDTWKTEIRNDPEIGGNRLETSLGIAKAVIEEYGGSKEQQAELWRHMSENQGNGMGSYLGFVRLMHNIGQAMGVFENNIVPAASAPAARSKEPGQRGWYGNAERRQSAG